MGHARSDGKLRLPSTLAWVLGLGLWLATCKGSTEPGGTIPTRLVFSAQPSNVVGGATFSVQVTAQDAGGHEATGATESVTLSIGNNPGGATLSGASNVVYGNTNNVATFSQLSIDKLGTGYTLSATGPGVTGATSAAFNVTAGAAAKLAFTVQPANANARTLGSPAVAVTVLDALGNTVTSATNSITVAIGTNPGGGTLSGTATVAAVNGVAAFSDLSIDKAGIGYTLTAAAAGLTGATSATFTVVGPAAKLAFTVQPSNQFVGVAIPLVVCVLDSLGNNVSVGLIGITIAIGTNPGGATLGGGLGSTQSDGCGRGSVTLSKAGTGYTLTASSPGLTGATSSAFNIQ